MFIRLVKSCLFVLIMIMVHSSLKAQLVVSESFSMDTDSASQRIGWTLDWIVHRGNAKLDRGDLAIGGYESANGLMRVSNDSVAVCQIEPQLGSLVYGSFRFKLERMKDDSVCGIVLCEHDLSAVKPELSTMSILPKVWRSETATLFLEGVKAKPEEGRSIQADQTYLVLFKIESVGDGVTELNVWIFDERQAASAAASGLEDRMLRHISVGDDPQQVTQRISVSVDKAFPDLYEAGSVICLFTRYGAEALFDEIHLSTSSFAEAAGLVVRDLSSSESVPYISN